jgi:hypothetical protein
MAHDIAMPWMNNTAIGNLHFGHGENSGKDAGKINL